MLYTHYTTLIPQTPGASSTPSNVTQVGVGVGTGYDEPVRFTISVGAVSKVIIKFPVAVSIVPELNTTDSVTGWPGGSGVIPVLNSPVITNW